MPLLSKISNLFGNSNEKALEKLIPLVSKINQLEQSFESKTNSELRDITNTFRTRISDGETLDDILPEAFALVRESAKRTLGQRHFDVQLMGGIVLHQGKIAEMRTGEGKTLVSTLPAYLNSLSGNGVHVVTVNDYLAKRDAEWMGPVYDLLGVSVSSLQNSESLLYEETGSSPNASKLRPVSKQEAYQADIVYGTNNEFGFDYLRDNMTDTVDSIVQKTRAFAIVDEVDNILIDEARTPLIISGPSQQNPKVYPKYSQISRGLNFEDDYDIDEKHKTVSLTPEGISKIENMLNVDNLYDPDNYAQVHYVENAVKAEVLYQRDKEYVVRNGEVLIVDEFTGRLMEGRRFSDGLHQAIEAKERVTVQRESVTYATITLQNYFRLYSKLSGMTGTAATEAEEFWKIYNLEVVTIPTNNPIKRVDHSDLIFKDQNAKYQAVAQEIESRIRNNQPVLVGTTDIDKSILISNLLKKRGIKHEVLNAKQHEREASIVSEAGKPGAVTVATNMAGRGTDIVLGGSWDPDSQSEEEWKTENEKVISAGGLCIIGTERHEARRIDNQLRGRSGRQGDPGETQFFCALDDDLVRRFGGEKIQSIMNWAGMEDEIPIENKMISKSIENAQVKVEAFHFDMRKNLVEYDDVINTHRDVIYNQRNRVLHGVELRDQIVKMMEKECDLIIYEYMTGSIPDYWEIDKMTADISRIIPLPEQLTDEQYIKTSNAEDYSTDVFNHIESVYDDFENTLGLENAKTIEQYMMLKSIDTNWVQHLTTMDNLRQGIGLQAVGQRDPLVMYKKEGHDLFQSLQSKIEDDLIHTIFRAEGIENNAASQTRSVGRKTPGIKASSGTTESRKYTQNSAGQQKVGRNTQCPCGSGKKYKRCCGAAA